MATSMIEGRTVVLLPPVVKAVRVDNESPVDWGSGFGDVMLTAARVSLGRHKVSVVDCEALSAPDVAQICSEIAPQAPTLSRGVVKEEARSSLQRLGRAELGSVVLAHTILTKVGAGASWNPNSGAIRSGNSASVLRAALVECASGAVLWKNEVLLRESLDGKEGHGDALQQLYEGSLEEDEK